jgi:hypothetical protein
MYAFIRFFSSALAYAFRQRRGMRTSRNWITSLWSAYTRPTRTVVMHAHF